MQANLPIVIDADGLWALSQDLSMIQGYNKCVLTPNAVEFERLRKQLMESLKHDGNSALHTSLSAEDVSLQVEAVSRALVRRSLCTLIELNPLATRNTLIVYRVELLLFGKEKKMLYLLVEHL